MSGYVPTIDEARDRYADARVGIGEWTRFDESVKRAVEDAYAEFDRMTAEVRRQAAEEAWDEGFSRGFYRGQVLGGDYDASEAGIVNPYEKAEV